MSARRGLPTLTLPAHPETAFDDKWDQGAGSYGRARGSLVAPIVTLDAFIALRGAETLVPGSHKRPSGFNSERATDNRTHIS